MFTERDLLFCRIALQKELLLQEQIEECIEAHEAGDAPAKGAGLAETILERGFLTVRQYEGIQKALERKLAERGESGDDDGEDPDSAGAPGDAAAPEAAAEAASDGSASDGAGADADVAPAAPARVRPDPGSVDLPGGWTDRGALPTADAGGAGPRGIVRLAAPADSPDDDEARVVFRLLVGAERRPLPGSQVVAEMARMAHVPGTRGLCGFREDEGGFGEDGAAIHLVRDYVAGAPFDRFVRAGGHSHRAMARTVVRMAEAAGALHGAGRVHGNLKPGNVILGAGGRPVLTDPWLGRPTDPEHVRYAAPELLDGTGRLRPAADVYSLGALLFLAVAHEDPRADLEDPEVPAAAHEGPPVPGDVRADVHPDLDRVVAWAMDPDPTRRYADGLELAADLLRLCRLQDLRGPAGLAARDAAEARAVVAEDLSDDPAEEAAAVAAGDGTDGDSPTEDAAGE